MGTIHLQIQRSTVTNLGQCLALCGTGHFVVDFACALTVVSLPSLTGIEDSNYYYLVILYNLLAFGSQPFWGWLIDRRTIFREGMTAGILLTGVGAAVAVPAPVSAVLLLGCGNALFHVGAGALVYGAAPGRASSQGLFVAPGGLGLLAGIMLGFRETVHPLWLVPLLIVTAILLYRLVPVAETAALPEPKRVEGRWILPTVLVLLLSVVAIRSFTGFALPIPWKGVGNGVLFLALASFAGKACGGFLAERFGWRPLCGIMLIIAAVMGVGHNDYLLSACIGLFCLQTTTGVTLACVQTLFPGRPAFAFGLPCIALLIGASPFFLPHPVGRIHPGLIVVVCLCAMTAITGALTMRKKGSAVKMSGLKTCSSALIGILFALTAYADVILPGGGPSRPHRAWIELYADRLPHGIILIFLDENGNLLEKAHEKEALRIYRSGTVYGVREKQLSAPFSLKTNKAKLYNLRTVTDDEIPSNYGRPNPLIMHCDTLGAGAGKYKLDCHEPPVNSK